jgi:hypothetical protein
LLRSLLKVGFFLKPANPNIRQNISLAFHAGKREIHICMDSHGLRQYALERATGFIEVFSFQRLLGTVIILLAVSSAGGCIATRLQDSSKRPVETGMEVFVRAEITQHTMDRICVLSFSSPPEMAAATYPLTSAFQARLVQRGPFRLIKSLPYEVKSDTEAIWYARSEGCELVMIPSLLYMMDGTGAMPTKLVVRTRILDARTCAVLWDIKQNACSGPGPDVDLVWTTIIGDPAQRCNVMADCLAQRFAEYLVQPLLAKEKQ